MTSLPKALALSFGQLGDPAILKVLGKSLLATLAVFLALGWALTEWLSPMLAEWAGVEGDVFVVLSGLLTVVAAWLLFRFVALAILQFFADEVVRAVEARHYPDHAVRARALPFREEAANSLRSTGRALLVNLLALPVALALLVTGIGTAAVFWAVNAFLLGRELQDMVWLRHRQDPAEVAPMGGPSRFALGGVVAAMLAIPFVNLIAPIIGAASATHMVHRSRKESPDA